MGKTTGFMEFPRRLPRRRPVSVRLRDWREVYEPFGEEATKEQGARCMDCGIPFCHDGCPLGNLIPEWNDLVYRDDWPGAMERLHATNNFPEFTGRLCPAPCEAACVLGINEDPVTIERIEFEIVERAWDEGWVTPQLPTVRTGKSVAVVGSGPAGLAAAQQLARAGHLVTVFERAEKPGGLLRYGIPEFKMEKAVLDRRLAQMEAEGVTFVCSTSVGGAAPVTAAGVGWWRPGARRGARRRDGLRARRHGAAGGRGAGRLRRGRAGRRRHAATRPARARARAGRHPPGAGVPEAVQPGPGGCAGRRRPSTPRASTSSSSAAATPGRTASARRTARAPPRCTSSRSWPSPRATGWPTTRGPCGRSSCAPPRPTRKAGQRLFSVTTTEFVDDGSGAVRALRGHTVEMRTEDGRPVFEEVPGSEFELECDLVLLAMGFVGHRAPQRGGRARRRGRAAGHRGGRPRLGHQRRRGLRLRGPDAGPEPDRLGHRRGALLRGGRRPLAHGHDGLAGADRARAGGAPLGARPSAFGPGPGSQSVPGDFFWTLNESGLRSAQTRRRAASPLRAAADRYCAGHAPDRCQRCLAVLRARGDGRAAPVHLGHRR